MELITNHKGNYHFLSGIAPFSSGVSAIEGYEIVHVTLKLPIPYHRGFDLIDEKGSSLLLALIKLLNESRADLTPF